MKIKKLILSFLTFLIAIMLTGCKKPIIQPEGRVIVNGDNYLMIPGGYQWKQEDVEIKTLSAYDIVELVDTFETVEVEKKETLKFEIDKNPPSVVVTKLNEDGSSDIVEMKDNQITMPAESGYYIYEIKTKWAEGKINFVFDVNVQ